MTTSTDLETRRARLRADVNLAARVVPTHYPLETFIAVNPLAGLEGMPFEQAIRRAGDLYGMPGTLGEPAFRQLYLEGRITADDLDRVLAGRYPSLTAEPELRLGGRPVTPLDLLRAEMLHGVASPDPKRRFTTRSEQRAPTVADAVDAQTSKWCAAFFGGAAWPMPGRENGFYSAWRSLAPGDRSVRRAARNELRAASERADDAVLAALYRLDVDDESRIGYLQGHLSRMPGWAAHIQWCMDDKARIQIWVEQIHEHEKLRATFDGQQEQEILPGDRLCIERARAGVLLVKPPRDYYQILRAKLKWGQS